MASSVALLPIQYVAFINIILYFNSFNTKTNLKGVGGASPSRVLKEASSMELHNSKLNSEVDGWKNKAKQYQADYEKLLLSSENSEKELKSVQQKLENCEKQLKIRGRKKLFDELPL